MICLLHAEYHRLLAEASLVGKMLLMVKNYHWAG
jgi:hypothetical protein